MKKLLISLLVVLAVAGGAAYYALGTSKSVDVQYTEKDYQSYLQKVKAASAPAGTAAGPAKAHPVTTTFTSAEITAMLAKELEITQGPVKDVRVKFLPNNELEASFVTTEKMKKYVPQNILNKYKIAETMVSNRPVYAKMKIAKASPKTIDLSLQDGAVGRIGATTEQLSLAESAIESAVNGRLQKLSNFSMDDVKFSDQGAYFKGNLQSVPRSVN